ncbi:hypothetical protein U9608_004651 [Vibrio alginolyticus]|nr:hypothetical protein [Vibrio alginolyticus]
MASVLEQMYKKLENTHQKHLDIGMSIMNAQGGAFYYQDMLFLAAINRSLGQKSAFLQLMKADNYLTALPMIRMQVDSILRLSATKLVSHPDKLAKQMLEGKAIRSIEDRYGNRMTDAYLLSKFKHEKDWLERVYQAGCGFIHLSEKHMFGLFADTSDDNSFQMRVSDRQEFIPLELRIEAIEAFYQSVLGIFELCEQHIFMKENPHIGRLASNYTIKT